MTDRMIYQLVDTDTRELLGEYDDYTEAAERLNNLNDQCGALAELRNISE